MNAETQQILTDRHYKEIQKGMAAMDRFDNEAKLAAGCGMPVEEMQADADLIRHQLAMFKQTYFPSKK